MDFSMGIAGCNVYDAEPTGFAQSVSSLVDQSDQSSYNPALCNALAGLLTEPLN
jgi:hypothetical protein